MVVETNEEIGIVDYLIEQKKSGRIRYLGFSAHGSAETIARFIAWGKARSNPVAFDFAQIQLNYLDWTLQNAKEKYDILSNQQIPIVVMEPCRGGRLAHFEAPAVALLKAVRPTDTVASWAFRFAKSLPHVQVVLSGMSSLEQLEDNIKTFSDPAPLSEEEQKALSLLSAQLINLVPCTACRYCCEECPQKLDIPLLIALFNEMSFEPSPGINFSLAAIKPEKLPSQCIRCNVCRQVCPQGLDVPDILIKLAQRITDYRGIG
ncbi:hypothetical protein PilKf_01137 [Pillotina sp. SPG140]